MPAGLIRDVLTVVVGVGTGVLSAAFGVGGAVVSTPAIRAIGVSAAFAIGTTLPSIFPSAVTGTTRYVREKLVVWRVVAWTAPLGIISAIGGSKLSKVVPGHGHWLMVLTAVLLGFNAYRMGRRPGESRTAEQAPDDVEVTRDSPAVLAAIGVAAGGLSGLLGVGGGVIMVPAFTELARLPVKTAIATSLACVAIFAIPSTLTHALQHDIDWRVALLLTIGVVPGARLGAAAAVRARDEHLQRTVAVFLGVISGIYFIGEVLALR